MMTGVKDGIGNQSVLVSGESVRFATALSSLPFRVHAVNCRRPFARHAAAVDASSGTVQAGTWTAFESAELSSICDRTGGWQDGDGQDHDELFGRGGWEEEGGRRGRRRRRCRRWGRWVLGCSERGHLVQPAARGFRERPVTTLPPLQSLPFLLFRSVLDHTGVKSDRKVPGCWWLCLQDSAERQQLALRQVHSDPLRQRRVDRRLAGRCLPAREEPRREPDRRRAVRPPQCCAIAFISLHFTCPQWMRSSGDAW